MTLLVALERRDGLVLAADSRGTFGDPSQITAQNDSQQKAHILSKHVAVLTSGAGEVASLLVQEAKTQIDADGLDGVTPVMEKLRETCRARYDAWFPQVPAIQAPALIATGQGATRPGVSFVVGGYDLGGEAAKPRLFHLPSYVDFAPSLSDYGWAVEGIGQYALYLLNRLYEPDRGVQELTALGVYVITETASQDGKVGGPVKVVTIKPGEGCVALADKSVEEVIEHNEARASALRDSFYERG